MRSNMTTPNITYHCPTCGGTSVCFDAWVAANDPADVRTFTSAWCDDCEQVQTHLTSKESN